MGRLKIWIEDRFPEVIDLVHLAQNGTASQIEIVRGSGTTLLDEAARAAVRRAEPFPAIPAIMPDDIDITVPIIFTLNGPDTILAHLDP